MDPELIKEIKEVQEEHEELKKEESKLFKTLKRIYVIIIALVLLSLLLVNTQTGYHLVSLVSGKLVSSQLNEDYSFDLKQGGKVYFDELVWKQLSYIYENNQKHEFKVCVTGEKVNNSYYATGIYEPYIYKQDVFSVTYQPCNSSTIISLHSHPPLSCVFSQQDMRSYEMFQTINKDGIVGLMCDWDTLTFYKSN